MKEKGKGKLLYRYSDIVDQRLHELKSLYGNLVLVTMEGERAVIIEQHNGILRYSDEEILIAAATCQICVQGMNMEIRSLDQSSIRIEGQILGVNYLYREQA